MTFLDFDHDETDIADELIRAIEKEYGRGIARILFLNVHLGTLLI
jgi:hypothetical protein